MSIFKREPRAVYRVYDEEEYLAGDQCSSEAVSSSSVESVDALDPMAADSAYVQWRPVDDWQGARRRRIAGIALLASVTVVVAVLIAAYAEHRGPSAPLPSSSERSGTPARSPSEAPVSRATSGAPPASGTHAPTISVTRSSSPPVATSTSRSARRRAPMNVHVAGGLTRRSPRRLQTPVTIAPAQDESSSNGPPTFSPAGAQIEFGFER